MKKRKEQESAQVVQEPAQEKKQLSAGQDASSAGQEAAPEGQEQQELPQGQEFSSVVEGRDGQEGSEEASAAEEEERMVSEKVMQEAVREAYVRGRNEALKGVWPDFDAEREIPDRRERQAYECLFQTRPSVWGDR